MRRDICYFFPASVDRVYNAYLTAATNARFRRECTQEPYHTIGFGLNFSMKYNMNGGACTIRFIPHMNGCAVNLRFSIAQLAGARYEKYAIDLTNDAAAVLGVPSQNIKIDVNAFLAPENRVTAASQPAPAGQPMNNAPQQNFAPQAQPMMNAQQAPFAPQPAPAPAPMPAPQPACEQKSGIICTTCGNTLNERDKFCAKCGTPAPKAKKLCPNCGTEAVDDPEAFFCTECGTKF